MPAACDRPDTGFGILIGVGQVAALMPSTFRE
jgi:hypothetical protein